ncbi:MAG: proline reductase-associated electron transfer protein PrdC [Tissierellia bacterium]|jgi:electron transport complex protein RnfC|nr:proline reductase-associated electron transfer protein PrdC [Bacillota bacterium]NLK58681.1 proline reductase-associated electron transfer protein PrdC [Tissierellia bacterium]
MIILSLRQGIGAPPVPVVQVNERVQRGQVVAEAVPDALSVPLHAPVTGKVCEVNEQTIRIEPEGQAESYLPLHTDKPAWQVVKDAGLLGRGGAGFPAYVKLQTQLEPGGYVLCNAAECEPVLRHNLAQMMEETDKLFSGMQIAMQATGAEKGIIGIKFKHKDVIKHLTAYIKEQNLPHIRVLPLRNRYPVGEERALIRDTVNQLLPAGALPVQANCIVFNVETLTGIHEAWVEKKPAIDKWITIAGRLNKLAPGETEVRIVPVGTRIADLVEDYGGIHEPHGEILLGGPHTGLRAGPDAAVQKMTGGMIVTGPFPQVEGPLGIIQCACGPSEERMKEIAASMGAEEITGYEVCKNATPQKVGYKCEDPGHCPGQAEKVLGIRKAGAKAVLIGHCTDCTNTVMGSAPMLGIEVWHCSDCVMDTMGLARTRTIQDENE